MNLKEAFLSALKNDGPPRWMGYAFEAFPKPYPMVLDPVTQLDSSLSGERYVDLWGVTWRHMETDPGAVPIVTEENKVIKDLAHWRDYVKLPDVSNLDWSGARTQLAAIDRDTTLVMIPSYYGPFERAHCLMPFEDVLVEMYTEPELMYDLFGALTDWKIEAMRVVIDNLQPDIIHSHDDWGDSSRLFFSPEVFRTLLKPHYKRLYDYIKSRGVLVQHHNDGFGQGLEVDMVEMGVDMWQGVLPENDIQAIKENTQGKLLLLGGIDQTKFDTDVLDENALRTEVRKAIDKYAPGGAFLPVIASVMPVNTDVLPIAIDEMNSYGEKWIRSNA